jgi:hypothetical protein
MHAEKSSLTNENNLPMNVVPYSDKENSRRIPQECAGPRHPMLAPKTPNFSVLHAMPHNAEESCTKGTQKNDTC